MPIQGPDLKCPKCNKPKRVDLAKKALVCVTDSCPNKGKTGG